MSVRSDTEQERALAWEPPNPYQADDVKRADDCITGAGWPAEEQQVNRL